MFASVKSEINRFVHVQSTTGFQNQEERPLLDNINNNRQHSKFLFFFLRSIKVSECAEHRKKSFCWSLHTVCFGREWCFGNSTVNDERFSSCYHVREYAGITPVKWFRSCHVCTLIRKIIMCYWSFFFFFFPPSYGLLISPWFFRNTIRKICLNWLYAVKYIYSYISFSYIWNHHVFIWKQKCYSIHFFF